MILQLASKLFGGMEDLLNLLRLWVLTIKSTVHDDIHQFKQRVWASQFPPSSGAHEHFLHVIPDPFFDLQNLPHSAKEPCSNISLAMDKPKAGSFGFVFKNLAWVWSPRLSQTGVSLNSLNKKHLLNRAMCSVSVIQTFRMNSSSSVSLDFSMLVELRIDTLWIENDEKAYSKPKTQHRITS